MDDLLPPPPTVTRPAMGPICHNATCTAAPLGQWLRYLTADEVAAEHAREQGKRDARMILRDVRLPPPDFGPLPDPASYQYVVMGCGDHAISLDAAALIHQADCSGPDSPTLPDCDCTPEQAAPREQQPESQPPAHWQTGTAGSS